MKEEASTETIAFIPERLNRRPAVFRGMTFIELILVMFIGAVIGALLGLLMILLFPVDWYAIPMGMLAIGYLSMRFGGAYISRLKRGKPDTWLERYVELKKSSSRFITTNTYWSIKRTPKQRGKK